MVRGGGLALKSLQWFLRAIEFCCAAVILAIFSYFLATLKNHSLTIDNYVRSIEGISGVAVLYTIIGLLLLCFVAGHTFFSLIAIVLDLAFVGAFIYVVYETRSGANSCSGTVNTVFGTGDADTSNSVPAANGGITLLPSFKQACRLETACFSVAIIAIVFFLLSAVIEVALWRHHKKEKAFGPSPRNNYTAGSTRPGGRFWQRNHHKRDATLAAGGLAAAHHEKNRPDSLPLHNTPADVRNSYNTDNTAVGAEPVYNKYGNGPTEGYMSSSAGHTAQNDGYTAPNAGYRNPEYATTGTTNATATNGTAGTHLVPGGQYPADSGYNY